MTAARMVFRLAARPGTLLGKVCDRPERHLGRQAERLGQRRVRMDREPDVLRVGPHLQRERELADQLAGVDADDPRAEDPAGPRLQDELGHALRAADAERAAGSGPREYGRLDLRAVCLGLRLGEPHPGDLGVGVGDARDRARVELDVLAGDHLGGDLALVAGLVASIGSPTMSPIAKMCGTLVRIWRSTGTKPRSSTVTPAA